MTARGNRRPVWPAALALAGTVWLAGSAGALYVVQPLGAGPISAETAAQYEWPRGTMELVNHPLRVQGWHGIFSGCANDVLEFGYKLVDAREANTLIRIMGRIKEAKPAVFIFPDSGHRWYRNPKEGYQATFQVGSQKILNAWWGRLPEGRFGVHVYKVPPTAMAPRLSLYLGDGKLDLGQLKIPAEVTVTAPSDEELRKANVLPVVAERIRAFMASRRDLNP